MQQIIYKAYVQILKEELIAAFGCTEPIAIAYASAVARDNLPSFPSSISAHCSGNVIKNVKGVFVPSSGKLRGIEASVYMGLVCGDANKKLEALSGATSEGVKKVHELMKTKLCKVELLENLTGLHIIIRMECDGHFSQVTIHDEHTNITEIIVDGKIIFDKSQSNNEIIAADRSLLSIKGIIEFANIAKLEDVRDIFDKQIECNMAIAEEGLKGDWGVGIGRSLMGCTPSCGWVRVKAYAAAASDARMGGCELPVVINSGSGNQGATVSLPIIIYAEENNISKDDLYRALIVSNLISIHIKSAIGRLSAYCGAVSAATGAGAGLTYLSGGDCKTIEKTIINTIGNASGMLCDGAKSSCAAKIAIALEAAIIGHKLAMQNIAFEADTGLTKQDIESTIQAMGKVAREGMRDTDNEILRVMLDQS